MISAVLLFNEDDNRELIKLSKQVNEQTRSLIKLNNHFLPHITLVQFNEPNESTVRLWHDIEHLKQEVRELTSSRLHCKPSPKHNQAWIELDFIKSEILGQLQDKIIKTDFAMNSQSHNKVGDDYHPHCTLALLEGQQIPELEIKNTVVLNREFTNLTLAVGLNGENFTFVETKFS